MTHRFHGHLVFLAVAAAALSFAPIATASNVAIANGDSDPAHFLFATSSGDGYSHPYLYRIDVDGNIVWEKPLGVSSLMLFHFVADRNLTEDAFYLPLLSEDTMIDGKKRVQKYDAAGNLAWDLALSANLAVVSANPVAGGCYAADYDQGIYRVDRDGHVVWGPLTFGLNPGPGITQWTVAADPKTGGGFACHDIYYGTSQVVHFDVDGQVLWMKDVYFSLEAVANPVDGGLYLAADYYGARTDRIGPDGEVVWSKSCFPGCYTYPRTVSPVDGSLYIASGGGIPGRLARVAMDGTVMWDVSNDDGAGHIFGSASLAADVRGNFFYTGDSYGIETGFGKYDGATCARIWHIPARHEGVAYYIFAGQPAASAPQPITAVMDIRPGSCPNPLNPRSQGVLPVALLGADGFDVSKVDMASVRLEGALPLRWNREDVAGPPASEGECACAEAGADGHMDLLLKFETQDLTSQEARMNPRPTRTLTLTGSLQDGTPFTAHDCVTLVGEARRPGIFAVSGAQAEHQVLSFELGGPQRVRLGVYDLQGRLVRQLADGEYGVGSQTIEWNAGGLPRGIYFYRLETGTEVQTTKFILAR